MSYQWSFNGLALAGATNAILALTNVQRSMVGEYFAVVMDSGGAATSRVARLEVYVRSGIFDIGDEVEFNRIVSTNDVLTRMATLDSWIEGVVWVPADGGYLVFSDLGANRVKKLIPPSTVTNLITPPTNTKFNGNILDLQERLISCQAGSAALQVVLTTNGVSVPLVTQYTNNAKFYSPNDLAMKSDGTVWFTDPGYDSGLPLPSGSNAPRGFQPGLYVYQFVETNGNATVQQVITNMSRPNGICLSPGETKLYVADTASEPGIIRVFDVGSDNTVTGGSLFCTVANGVPDGIKADVDGRIWSSAGDGVEIFAPDGHWIGTIRLTRTANLCFGGPQYKTLYMVGQPYVTSFPVLVAGAVSMRKLRAAHTPGVISLAWRAPSTGFKLQETTSLHPPAVWKDVVEAPTVLGEFNQVNLSSAEPARYYRLDLRSP